MGKRKSKSKPPPKKRMDKLDTVFSCPFCSHGTSVECRIDMKNLIGEANCRICQESFSTTVTGISSDFSFINLFIVSLNLIHFEKDGSIALTEAIDIYSEWIDECERVNNLEDDDGP
ncbi:hypothetical protein MTR67_009330 [Solanum verrucosum]|uniref:Transcription elongation factor 1 homolog n=1 Tax=Solanum verrucosum TaxID=315347 RepID=A0AAF0Q6Z7_SOLVR|nr:hypothetical protein MTR67_009330 [Solanum verrucosum]